MQSIVDIMFSHSLRAPSYVHDPVPSATMQTRLEEMHEPNTLEYHRRMSIPAAPCLHKVENVVEFVTS
jgi:hypothetical protein